MNIKVIIIGNKDAAKKVMSQLGKKFIIQGVNSNINQSGTAVRIEIELKLDVPINTRLPVGVIE